MVFKFTSKLNRLRRKAIRSSWFRLLTLRPNSNYIYFLGNKEKSFKMQDKQQQQRRASSQDVSSQDVSRIQRSDNEIKSLRLQM